MGDIRVAPQAGERTFPRSAQPASAGEADREPQPREPEAGRVGGDATGSQAPRPARSASGSQRRRPLPKEMSQAARPGTAAR